jgi:predicted GNAT family N-acyltransferase
MKLHAPQPLTADHQLNTFNCGETSLDEWLKRRALLNQTNGASRTFVVVDESQLVMGYYALAAGAVHHQDATRSIRQNMPDPIPVMVLARLAVDIRTQGMQLGAGLLRDAVDRSLAVAKNTGVRALLVHALHERAKQFYLYFGFQALPVRPLTLMLRLKA